MANKITDTQYYTAIANAIRSKLGVQTTYTPPQMAAAILSIPSGGADIYRFSLQNKVYGAGANYLQYATEQHSLITEQQIALLGVKKVRVRGKLVANSSHNSRQCTANLIAKTYAPGSSSPNYTNIGSVSSGTNSSGQINIDTTFDLVTDNIGELDLQISVTSSYSSGTYPIDQYCWGGYTSQGLIIDGVTWWGLVIDYLFS